MTDHFERCDQCYWWTLILKARGGEGPDENEGICKLNPPKIRKSISNERPGGFRAIDFACPVTYAMNFCSGFKADV